jgi:hypothetical protein
LNPKSSAPRSFVVTLSSPTGGAIFGEVTSLVVTIFPPADPPRVSISATSPHALRAGPIPGVFTIARDIGADVPLTVTYTVSGSATPGVDYAPLSGSLVIPAGQYSATLDVRPIGGSGDKLLTVTLTSQPSYLLGRSSATIDITGVYSTRVYLPAMLR